MCALVSTEVAKTQQKHVSEWFLGNNMTISGAGHINTLLRLAFRQQKQTSHDATDESGKHMMQHTGLPMPQHHCRKLNVRQVSTMLSFVHTALCSCQQTQVHDKADDSFCGYLKLLYPSCCGAGAGHQPQHVAQPPLTGPLSICSPYKLQPVATICSCTVSAGAFIPS